MAAAVRVLLRDRVARTTRTTVPPGKVWIVTSVHVHNPMPTDAVITLLADDFPIAAAAVPAKGTYVLDTRQVLLAGQGLGLNTTTDGVVISASGVQDAAVQVQIQDVLVGTATQFGAAYATINDIGSN